ncbi:MAG TPA: DUF692 domain-containing protein [Usitatibacter sp.]|nr:DUF692 domain-containing protein [Usitatibacter sp.]
MARAQIPAPAAGIGLRAPHYAQLLERRPALAFLEVHSENFFAAGGPSLAWLERFRGLYPMSFHGVGLSLGSSEAVDAVHLAKLASLVERFEPAFVSEHVCWSSASGRHSNDLLPLPYTEEALDSFVAHVDAVQERLGRTILVENVSSYMRFGHSTIPEWEFVAEVARASGCGVLLDVNNVWVNSVNHGFDPRVFLAAIDPATVAEIHLAGFEAQESLLVDTHSRAVTGDVWSLFREAIARMGPRPTLIEWDADIPELDVLLGEAGKAEAILDAARRGERAA